MDMKENSYKHLKQQIEDDKHAIKMTVYYHWSDQYYDGHLTRLYVECCKNSYEDLANSIIDSLIKEKNQEVQMNTFFTIVQSIKLYNTIKSCELRILEFILKKDANVLKLLLNDDIIMTKYCRDLPEFIEKIKS